jgi:hypothetical protein
VILEIFLLVSAGAFAVFLHHKLRIPLNIPGHHGLEFMAIFVLLRMSSGIRFAATLATLGVGIMLLIPGVGASNPFHSLGYLLPGLVLDASYHFNRKQSFQLLVITLSAGLAYMSIPLSRLLVQLLTAYTSPAFIKFGAAYTILSFMFFGMLGGALGYGLHHIRLSTNKPKDQN